MSVSHVPLTPPIQPAALAALPDPKLPAVPGVRRLSPEAWIKYHGIPFGAGWRFRAWRHGRWHNPEYGLLRYLVPRGLAAIDVGANLGIVSYYLARHASRVFACEPSPVVLPSLRHLVPDKVEVWPVAVSDRTASITLPLWLRRRGWTVNGATLEEGRTGDLPVYPVPVEAIRLDDVDLPPIGFLKIDVEGHEGAVLDGAEQTLARHRPVLMVENEFHHVGGGIDAVFDRMRRAGYRILGLKDGVLTDIDTFDVAAFQAATLGRKGRYMQNFFGIPL